MNYIWVVTDNGSVLQAFSTRDSVYRWLVKNWGWSQRSYVYRVHDGATVYREIGDPYVWPVSSFIEAGGLTLEELDLAEKERT